MLDVELSTHPHNPHSIQSRQSGASQKATITNQVAGFYKWPINKLKQGDILMVNPASPITQSLINSKQKQVQKPNLYKKRKRDHLNNMW